jgi:opacity protein-like surface antigen
MRRCSLFLFSILFAATSFATSFTITVPNRVVGPVLMPIARVKMTVVTNANAGASTLTVSEGGNAPVPVTIGGGFVFLGNPNPDTPNSDDTAKLSLDPADSNSIVIEIVLRHVMSDPGNFCVIDTTPPPPASWSYSLNLTTPGTIQGYRLSSYGAAGLVPLSNPTNCAFAKRRIFSTPATSDLAATNLGRHPQDIVLVLDNSGSMALDTPGDLGESRMAVLNASASMFMSMWETEGFNATATGGTGLAGDRLGLVWFSTDLTLPFPNGVSQTALTPRGPMPGPGGGHPWNPIQSSINTMGPTNLTAIGKGLQAGLDSLSTSSNDTAIVLMTDGIQNQDPMVERVGVDPNATVQIHGGPDLASFTIPVLTVSLGVPGGVDPALFDDVARKTAGRSRLTATSAGSASSFGGSLVSALLGNTLLVATEGTDSLPGGAPAAAPVTVPLDGSIKRATFALSWSTKFPNALDLEIVPPGGGKPIPPDTRARGATWLVYGVNIPASGPAGDWHVRVVRFRSTGEQLPAVDYYLGAYTYEGKLDLEGALPPQAIYTGDSVTVRTELAFDHMPVTTAEGHVRLRIARPGESIGNLLHDTDVPPAVLTTEISPDKTNPYQRKLNNLAKSILSKVDPAPLPADVPLHHDGNGLYSATFTDTSKAGQYKFLLTYDFDAPDGSGRIHRIEQLERDIKIKPDPGATVASLSPGQSSGTWIVVITPKDRFGNYMGPGYSGRLAVSVNGIGTVTAIQDPRETGDYVATITGVPAGTTPVVVVVVDGVPVPVPGGTIPPPIQPLSGAWRYFLDLGPNFPHGSFANGTDGKWSLNAGFERLISSDWSVEGILGYHRFDAPFISNPHIWQFSVNGKRWFGTGTQWHPFLNAGVGAYRFDPGNTTKFGWNAGGGVLYDVTSTWGVEGVYNYHSTRVGGGNTADFSTVQAGARIRF